VGTARPTFERRQLGLTLRRLRDRAGKPQQAAALALNKTRTRVVQLEDGTATISQEDLETLLDLYEVTGEERETVIELANQARKRQKRRVYVDQLPDAYQRWADLEASASEINCFETGLIPGLLQSESYMRALLSEGEVFWEPSVTERSDRLAYRLERQRRMVEAPDGRMLRFVINEEALRANMGALDVMHEQLRHLLDLDRAHGDLTIRVLANDAFGNPLRGQSLWYFGFGDRGAPICYSPSVPGPSTYYDRETDTTTLLRAFYRVWELALSRTASRRLIESLLKE
jgi:transcriptional regulator with XRE-family HTH domain